MKRKEWYLSSSALRKLLKDLPLSTQHPGETRLVQYKFGGAYNPRYHLWEIWNGKTRNIIATLKYIDGRVVIRYRPNSFYAGVFKNRLVFDGLANGHDSIVRIPTDNVSRHHRWVKERIEQMVNESISSFLALKASIPSNPHWQEMVNRLEQRPLMYSTPQPELTPTTQRVTGQSRSHLGQDVHSYTVRVIELIRHYRASLITAGQFVEEVLGIGDRLDMPDGERFEYNMEYFFGMVDQEEGRGTPMEMVDVQRVVEQTMTTVPQVATNSRLSTTSTNVSASSSFYDMASVQEAIQSAMPMGHPMIWDTDIEDGEID